MARKFKIGDIVGVVKVLGHTGLGRDYKIGHRGKIIHYTAGGSYPYVAKRKNGIIEYFNAKELKLIRKGT